MKILAVLIVLGLCKFALADDAGWKPAASPLMTRFAKDVDPKNVLPEYPRPQMVRAQWKNLNGLWDYTSAGESGKILVPFCIESSLSGVGKRLEKFTCRRTVKVPGEWKGQRVLLHFGAVDYEAVVSVNGKEVGRHVGGYDAFTFDITDALKPGGEQVLEVAITDTTDEVQPRGKQIPNPHGIWYTPVSGIWQTVWLEPVPAKHIESIKITPRVDEGGVQVDVAGADEAGGAAIEVLDGDRKIASGKSGQLIKIADAKLWSPENPFLYNLRITAGQDKVESYFGMRKVEISKDEKGIPRIKLNGESILQIGPLDQGWWPDGLYTAPTDEALKYDLDVTRKLGFNMIRKHVKVEPQRWYYHADRMGFLVWQDMPSTMGAEKGEWQKQFEAELKTLVEQHYNSPSIIMWVPLNEGWGQDARKKEDGSVGQAPYDKQGTIALGEKVKSWDPTRLVNDASGWTDHGGGDVHDIHNYPGPAAPPIEKERAIVLGEFGGLGLPIEGHLWQTDKNWGYQNMGSRDELTDKYVRLLGRLWTLMEEQGLCAGVYTQTTDVEGEVNGLMTYDRAIIKVDEARTRDANTGKGPRIDVVGYVKTAREEPAEWKYTTEKPSDDWFAPGFDDSSWKTGKSGFGTNAGDGAVVNTTWDTPDIWLRREVEVAEDAIKDIEAFWYHGQRAELYINGVLASRTGQHTTDYVEQRIKDEARAALKPGKNVIAVHSSQIAGGRYIDVGFIRLVEKKKN